MVASFPQRTVRPGAALPLAEGDSRPLTPPERAPAVARRGAGARHRSFLQPDREAHPHHCRTGGLGSPRSRHEYGTRRQAAQELEEGVMDTMQRQASYDIGGVRYPQPFKIRRLGHFGFNVPDLEAGIDFYARLLGFRITDTRDFSKIPGREEMASRMQDARIVFMSHNTDHHAFLLAHKSMGAIFGDDAVSKDVTVNQITWQVGTMEEVFAAADYFSEKQVEIRRVGRDMPGSNWHTYIRDPDGHTVELYYGMEQIGWDGRSKPESMYYRAFRQRPDLPQISEEQEIREAVAKGVDINAGNTMRDRSHEEYVVAGVRLPRPFKIVNIGPMALFVADVGASEAFYTETMGFVRTE